ncbi:MAG TPA: SCO family protein [Chitinophagaceae bacterium]|nr:SCO family protein [Chitinophagaceae bacterium]
MNKKALIAVCIAVLIPLVCYIVLKQASDNAVELPGHYLPDRTFDTTVGGKMRTDTVWHTVANIRLVNQLGDTVNLYDIKGKAIVMDFFFTSCGSICPTLTRNMAKMQRSFKEGGDPMDKVDTSVVHFLSFTVDPETDTVAKLKKYADHYKIDPDNWWLLTGSKDSIYNFAFDQLKVDKFSTEPIDPSFVHTSRFVLLDKYYQVRGYYNGLDTVALSKLSKDIGLLMLEKDKGGDKLPFDPLEMGIFLILAIVITIIVVTLLFRKKKPAPNLILKTILHQYIYVTGKYTEK